MKVGFIGLGSMGAAMARCVAAAGHELTLWNRSREKAEALAEQTGAALAASPAEAAGGAEVVVTMVSDGAAVEAVTLGEDGLLEGLAAGAVHACASTIGPGLARRLTSVHAERGARYVAAPVFGRPDMAREAKLWIVAAGAPAAIEKCRPVLESMGQEVVEAGAEPALANVIKIAGNFLLASAIEAMGEAAAMVRAHGIDAGRFLDIAVGRVIRSPVYEAYGGLIAAERYEPAGFELRHGLKDTRLALAAAAEAGASMPLAELLRDRFEEAAGRGWERSDWAVIGRLAAVEAGLGPAVEEGAA